MNGSERQVVLDTETTGLEVTQGHRVVEIGCVEIRNRRVTDNGFHHFLNPEREIDAGALGVHGISRETLADKPRFAEIAASLVEYLRGAELIIHNAEFDVGFLNEELRRAGRSERIQDLCTVTDSLLLARKLHPGQRNNLDALCQRYSVNNANRDLHGALLDARLLAGVYLTMTGGQSALVLERAEPVAGGSRAGGALPEENGPLVVIRASDAELVTHWARLRGIFKKAGRLLWQDELPPTEKAA